MKLLIAFLICFLSLYSKAQNCDSIIVIFNEYFDDLDGPQILGYETDSGRNGLIMSMKINSNPFELNRENLLPGVYILSRRNGENVLRKRIVVE